MNLFDLKTWKSWIYICKYLLANEWQGYQRKLENHKKKQFEELPSLVYNINFFLDRDILQKLLFLNKNKDIVVVDKKHYLYWFIYHVDLSHFVFYVVQCIVFVYKYLPMMDRLGFFSYFCLCVTWIMNDMKSLLSLYTYNAVNWVQLLKIFSGKVTSRLLLRSL